MLRRLAFRRDDSISFGLERVGDDVPTEKGQLDGTWDSLSLEIVRSNSNTL